MVLLLEAGFAVPSLSLKGVSLPCTGRINKPPQLVPKPNGPIVERLLISDLNLHLLQTKLLGIFFFFNLTWGGSRD